jgi:outer membrane protein OmpA-like peptidoglycan-associated protein
LGAYRFSIEGHADPRGNEGDNLELSRARAESVAAYLSEQHQVARARLSAIGKGQAEIINLTQIDAPENRRVTIKTVVQ